MTTDRQCKQNVIIIQYLNMGYKGEKTQNYWKRYKKRDKLSWLS